MHARETRYQPTPQERTARAKELLAERVEKQTRVRILQAIRKKLSGSFVRPDFEMAASRLLPRLGDDNHRRVLSGLWLGREENESVLGQHDCRLRSHCGECCSRK